jgi:hypothetical protein
MAKRIDPAKAKEAKQKKIAIAGAVLLIGLLVFEVPKVMKMMNQKPPPGSFASTTTTAAAPTNGAPSLAAPTLQGTAQTAAATTPTGDGVTSGDGAPSVQQGQLASFSRFVSKDPFAQQITPGGSSTPSPSSGGSPSSSGSSGPSSSSGPAPSGTQPGPSSAVISINGTLVSATVGTDFPASQPIFHLVSLTAHTAQISIAGGTFVSGTPTITLHQGKPLTLMNTADGTRYKLILEPQGTPIPAPPSAPTTTQTTTTASPSGH